MAFPGLKNLIMTCTDVPASPLTLEKLQEVIEPFRDPAARLREWERMRRVGDGEVILIRARKAGIISEREFCLLLIGVHVNGGLIVSSDMRQRLEAVL